MRGLELGPLRDGGAEAAAQDDLASLREDAGDRHHAEHGRS